MTGKHPSPPAASRASARFFIRVGQAGRAAERRCEHTLPLFPLALILEADGTLREDARAMVERIAA